MPERERKRVPYHRSNILKESHPQGPPAHPRNMEYLRLSEESEKESRDEATQRSMGDCVEADESCFVLNPAADW